LLFFIPYSRWIMKDGRAMEGYTPILRDWGAVLPEECLLLNTKGEGIQGTFFGGSSSQLYEWR
jgi:hypothetical protein